MEKRTIGKSALNVSKICLGTMTWGQQNTESDAHNQLDMALDYDVNFIDTAEVYAVPIEPDTSGLTEKYIGSWLANRKNRDKVIIATKITGKGLLHIRNGEGFTPAGIETAVNDSLKRLQTDYIDLYQLHWPQRDINKFGVLDYIPQMAQTDDQIEETLWALSKVIKEGKVRYIGLSNETPWGVMKFLEYAKEKDLPYIVSVQNAYNLLNRLTDIHLSEVLIRENIGFLPYSPLAGGLLTGKYLGNKKPKGARFSTWGTQIMPRYINERTNKAIEIYCEIAQEYNISPTKMALSFVNDRPYTTSNIIGATTLEQLKECLESAYFSLSTDILKTIEDSHINNPNTAS